MDHTTNRDDVSEHAHGPTGGSDTTGSGNGQFLEYAEQVLNVSRLLEAYDSIQDIVGIQLPDHRIVAYNKTGYEFLKMTPDEVRGKTCYELIGRISPCVPCTTQTALETGLPAEAERYFPELNRYVRVRCMPVFNDRGEITYFIEQLSDITARKHAEMALTEQSARYRSLVEDSPYGFIVTRGDRISYVNNRLLTLCGIDRRTMTGNTIDTFLACVHKEDREQIRQSFQSCQNESIPHERLAFTITGSDNTVRAMEMHVSRMLFDGRPACQCLLLDITDTRDTEHSLWQSQAKYLRIFNNLQDVYYETDINGIILEISPSIESVSQYTRNSLIGHNVSEFYNIPDNRNMLLETIQRKGKIEDYEVVFTDADGRNVDCSLNSILVTDPIDGQQRIVGSLRVITDRKQLERKLMRLVEEKETLVRETHHRVKNNMQVITSLLYLQAEQADDPAYSKLLNESISRIGAMSMIHDLLHRSNGADDVDMHAYLEILSTNTRTLYHGERTDITFSIVTHGIHLTMDRAIPCGLIVTELVSNAFKHGFATGDTGVITIVLQPLSDGRLKLTALHSGKGFQSGYDWRQSKSLGLKLAAMLAEHQLGGSMELSNPAQSAFTLIFQR